MSRQFEFVLLGGAVPEGQLRIDDLFALIKSIKEIASRIGRSETAAEMTGRAPKRVHRVADLVVGLAPGSTRLQVRRSRPEDALDIELADEQSFDEKFEGLVEALALNARPDWMDGPLAHATLDFGLALQSAAPEIEFRVDGGMRNRFATASIDRESWQPNQQLAETAITFVGRLRAVNLDSHRLQVRDDIGNKVGLPEFLNDAEAGPLLDRYVSVVGLPVYRPDGTLFEIRQATAIAASDPFETWESGKPAAVADLLSAVPGPDPSGGIDLSDDEFAAFLQAARE